MTVIDGCKLDDVVKITAHHVNITGFTVQEGLYYGIRVESHYNNISGNNITNNNFGGISGEEISHNSITKNIITNNQYYGIFLPDSSHNSITRNIVTNNRDYDICLDYSSNDTVADNNFESNGISIFGDSILHWNTHIIENNTANGRPIRYYKNTNDAVVPSDTAQVILANCSNFTIQNLNLSDVDGCIQLGFSSYINIIQNNIANSSQGITIHRSNNNIISRNTITDNYYHGILLKYSSNNIISENNITDNERRGISLKDSHNNNISGNNIMRSKRMWSIGLDIRNSYDNVIYHNNFINNTKHAWDSGINIWDNGYPSGGNFWDDHDDHDEYKGPNQDEEGSDGIVDQPGGGLNPYNISDGENQDKYPFMNPCPLNHPPYAPSNPSPLDEATDVAIDAVLSWSGGDPDGDSVTYDVYFGTTSSPPQVATGQLNTMYDPGTLQHETTYYWKIVAWDSHNVFAEGPIWIFTAEKEDTIPPTIKITKPEKVIYLKNKKTLPFFVPLIIGSINIEVNASDTETEINQVEFYIDDELKSTDTTEQYSWTWSKRAFLRHTIKVIAYDGGGNSASDEIVVWKFF